MLDFSRFEVLTFDCYGTLINWEDGILRCLHRVLATHDKDTDDVTTLQCYGDFEAKAESGKYHSYRKVLESMVKQFGERFGFTPTEQEAGSLAESLKGWEPWPDSFGALRELRDLFRLAIISNVDDDLFAVTEPKLGIKFNEVITAQQAQAYKPALKIFDLALSRIAVPVDRTLHVGQSLYHDVIPAKSLGLATVWVNRPSARCGIGPVKAVDARPDFEVNSLAELVSACAKVGPPKRSKS